MLSQGPESYTSKLYQNAEVNQDMKGILVWSKKTRNYAEELKQLHVNTRSS